MSVSSELETGTVPILPRALGSQAAARGLPGLELRSMPQSRASETASLPLPHDLRSEKKRRSGRCRYTGISSTIKFCRAEGQSSWKDLPCLFSSRNRGRIGSGNSHPSPPAAAYSLLSMGERPVGVLGQIEQENFGGFVGR